MLILLSVNSKLIELSSSNVSSSGVLSQIDKKIKTLMQTKKSLEQQESNTSFTHIVPSDLDISEDLGKLKAIQRERLLEDMSSILNGKIHELEEKEHADKEREKVLNELTVALNEKIFQLEIANKTIAEQKKHSDELNLQLQETVKKLTEAEKELKIERDWLADQVEKKSLEVLTTIDQLIKAEKSQ